MNIKNKFSSLFLILLISFINGCNMGYNRNTVYSNIYNDNEKIAQTSENHIYTTADTTKDSDRNLSLKYSGFLGVDAIWSINSKENGEITLDYDSKVNSGDFKIVLVNPKKEIENILIGTDHGRKTLKLSNGEYVLKLVGNNANGNVKLTISQSKNAEIALMEER
ncbi:MULTISPECIES: hypothetical protein [unclassified Clostridium]|uniref:hypothetical protein n=1 Tax=unclassified Clostridium TaxID=2614128 RepID=UPI000297E2CB|nr:MULTISPECIES: hypothetical protein [unclassified Clostridium]EKQ53089.1 MAG: hypothetical protein A370_03941 [Clostridium sp. Maddingley MBC34-26]